MFWSYWLNLSLMGDENFENCSNCPVMNSVLRNIGVQKLLIQFQLHRSRTLFNLLKLLCYDIFTKNHWCVCTKKHGCCESICSRSAWLANNKNANCSDCMFKEHGCSEAAGSISAASETKTFQNAQIALLWHIY